MESTDTYQKRILIVDDDRSVVRALELVLKHEGFQVLMAFNGRDGLQLAWEQRPDLIILDIIMPLMNGYRLCRYLQSRPETKDIPVVMLTVKGQVDDPIAQSAHAMAQRIQERLEGFDAGAIEFLSKPVKAVEVIAQVKKILGLMDFAEKTRAPHH